MIWLFLFGALPVDPVGDPLPRYLSSVEITKHLSTFVPKLRECDAPDQHTERVSFMVYGDGGVRDIRWSGEPVEAQTCWAKVFTGHQFPTHDDAPISVETTLYVRSGELSISPQPDIEQRTLGPLMLFVLPENSAAISRHLHESNESSSER